MLMLRVRAVLAHYMIVLAVRKATCKLKHQTLNPNAEPECQNPDPYA